MRVGARLGWLLLLAACAGSPTAPQVTRALPLPEDRAARKQLLGEIGRRIYGELRAGTPERLLLDDLELERVLDGAAASRSAVLRARGLAAPPPAELRAALTKTSYAGACFDRARPVVPAGELGLRQPGFVFDRVLVVGQEASGTRVAAWLEGTFLATDAGVYALLLSRVEVPRREHSDLAIQQCDLADGLD
jgi:hypothetical protein